MKTIVKYPGSKWRLAEQIVSLFPKHHSYLEPFFGSGAVLFSKPRSNIETVNDLDGDVANLFQCIQKDPEKLSRMVYFTPFSRQIYNESYNSIPSDPYEKAVWFLIRCNMGYGYRTNGYKVGWKRDVQGRERAYAAKDWSSLPGRVFETAERLRGVQIECRPATELIAEYNYKNVLIYCDPPYMAETRSGGTQYKKEMSDHDHELLLKQLLRHTGPVLLSGYHSGHTSEDPRLYVLKSLPEYDEVQCKMPKLEFETTAVLNDMLSGLGLDNIFSSNADFSGIADRNVNVDTILQKTKLELDENGTKAAAVTAVIMECMSAAEEDEPIIKTVELTRPFAFLIYDSSNDEILFMGKVMTVSR